MKMFSPDGLLRHVADEKVDERLAQGWTLDTMDNQPASVSALEEARKPKPNDPPNRVTRTRKK